MNGSANGKVEKRFVLVIAWPLGLMALNAISFHIVRGFIPDDLGYTLFNVLVRFVLVFWAGWNVVRVDVGGLKAAALAGVLLLFIDHPVVTGVIFLASGEVMAFGGVIISFVMFAFVPALVATLGGWVARQTMKPSN